MPPARPYNSSPENNGLQPLPEGPFRFIALDVETANGSNASICQIGLSCVDAFGRQHGVSQLINPCEDFFPFNIDLHGIGPETVRYAPTFDTVFDAMRPLLEAHPLVQHSTFDKSAMAAACRQYRREPLESQWHDSVKIARQAWPELKGNGGHGLASLKSHLALDFDHHDAAEDARAAAQVVLRAEDILGQLIS